MGGPLAFALNVEPGLYSGGPPTKLTTDLDYRRSGSPQPPVVKRFRTDTQVVGEGVYGKEALKRWRLES